MKAPLFIISFLMVVVTTTHAQMPEHIKGTWHGKMRVGFDLHLTVHFFTDSLGRDTVSLDSPDQGVKNIPGYAFRLSGDSIWFQMDKSARYAGRFKNDTTISGLWMQGGNYTLELKKGAPDDLADHPQTPRPPFPYRSEEVEYDGVKTKLHYGATITVPPGKGPFPALVLITGSGAQDRDETLLGHKTFAVLADHLTRNGFVVLRVDDRGVGKSTGDFGASTSADFADDTNEAVDWLLHRPEADKKRIGLAGHSEGGMIAPIVASRRKDIAFVVLLAGPGVPIIDLMATQQAEIAKSNGVRPAAADSFTAFYKRAIPLIVSIDDKEQARQRFADTLDAWLAVTPKNVVFPNTGIYNDTSKKAFINTMVRALHTPWFRYFMQFNPQPYLMRLHCKVLALNGSRDIQVASRQNLDGIAASLKKSKSPYYETKELPGLNHLFQTCRKCTLQEYGELTETFSPAALTVISDWLKKNIQ